ncbi:TolC family protein [Clostridium sp. P21]|uniref:TolC family protein n=1 Tax=Clostridium muellerianum TaxID=2716538 RepID=A0A7Y0HQS6_9CLOT|nr:TolC family protein [Clostridium muellerianum]NMM65072.1 TolC family protein [Clostridium muellerianum]
MKRLRLLCITAALTTTLFSSTVFAAGAAQSAQNLLDVDKAIDMAIENSYSLKKLDLSISQLKNNYVDSQRNAAGYDDQLTSLEKLSSTIKNDSLKLNLINSQKLSLIQGRDFIQLEYKYAIFQYTNIKQASENELKAGVYKLYSGLVSLKEGLDVEQQNFNNVEDQYKKAQFQLQLGLVSKADVKTSEASYLAEKAKLNQYQRQYDAYTKQLNQLLGVDINTRYTGFTKDNLATSTSSKSYDDYVKDALANRIKIKNDNEMIDTKKMEFYSVRGVYNSDKSPQYEVANYPVEAAKNKLETDKIDISIEINNLYNDLQVKVKKLEPAKKDYDSMKKTYDKASQSYNLGLISKIDFDKAAVGLKAKEIALKSIQRDIWLAQTNLNYASDIGADGSTLASANN